MPRKSVNTTGRRGTWSGDLRFSLVSFPVVAVNAQTSDREEIHFNQLHAGCNSRIRYQKVCPIHGPVDNDEIVMGYEQSKDQYVAFEPDELKQLRSESSRVLSVDTFIASGQLDPIYFNGRHYFLLPASKDAAEPYALFVAALAKLDRYAIGTVTFSRREHLVAIRAHGEALLMSLLHRQTDVREAEPIERPAARASARKTALAETLIKSATERRFDIGAYEDEYQQRVREAIEAKVEGKQLVEPEETAEPPVINLMDALRKSVEQARQGSSRGNRSAADQKPAARGSRGSKHAPAKQRRKSARQRAS